MSDLTQFDQDAQKVCDVFRDDLSTIKTGRAKPSLIEQVLVEAYGTRMPIVELATISAPDPTLLVIKPWDKSVLTPIQKAIAAAPLGLNPNVDSDQIRIPIPPLTEERRNEMVKLVKQKLEAAKQMLRDVRQKHKKNIDDSEGQPGVSEDDIHDLLEELQKKTEATTVKLDSIAQDKQTELQTM
jgi:ribosome recycling factor